MVTSRPQRGRLTINSTVFQCQCLKLHLGCTHHFGVYLGIDTAFENVSTSDGGRPKANEFSISLLEVLCIGA